MHRAPELIEGDSLLFGHHQVHGQEYGAGRVDGHGSGDLIQGDALEEALHVRQGVDGDPHFAHFALGQGVVGVEADLGGQVEGHRKAGLAGLQQEVITLVGLIGGAKAGVLAHRPVAAPIGGGLHRPGVRVLAREAQFLQVVEIRHIQRRIDPGDGDARGVDELGLALRRLLEHLGHLFVILGLAGLNLF